MQLRSMVVAILATLMLPAVASATFAPKNDLWKEDNMSKRANMTEQEFNDITNAVINTFKPYAAAHGATLQVNADWNDATVNASSNQSGTDWFVNMYGGLARRDEVTDDGYRAVICHELGHHFGGYPFFGEDWGACEGEADYFATHACLPLLWANEKDKNATFRTNVPQAVQQACDAAWNTTDAQNLCYRIQAAGQSLGNLLAKLGGNDIPDVTKPDPNVLQTTNTDHPEAQCRLDTYFNAGLCTTAFDMSKIPGRNNASGQGSKAAQDEAATTSCLGTGAMQAGERPRCWFAPLTQ